MKGYRFLALCTLLAFSVSVCGAHSCAATISSKQGVVAKAKVLSIDQLFVCTASTPYIFVEPTLPYAPAKNVTVSAPAKVVEARCNSPSLHY